MYRDRSQSIQYTCWFSYREFEELMHARLFLHKQQQKQWMQPDVHTYRRDRYIAILRRVGVKNINWRISWNIPSGSCVLDTAVLTSEPHDKQNHSCGKPDVLTSKLHLLSSKWIVVWYSATLGLLHDQHHPTKAGVSNRHVCVTVTKIEFAVGNWKRVTCHLGNLED